MKISLDHLPPRKQRQLADVTATLCEMAPVEMVILFGCFCPTGCLNGPALWQYQAIGSRSGSRKQSPSLTCGVTLPE